MLTYKNLYNYLLINVKEKSLVTDIINNYCEILFHQYKIKFDKKYGTDVNYCLKYMRDAECSNTLFYLWLVKQNVLNEIFSNFLINKNPIPNIKNLIINNQEHLSHLYI